MMFRIIGIGRGPWMTQLNVSDTDLEKAAARAERDNLTLLAGRFEKDRICPAARLDRLQTVFGARFVRREFSGGSFLNPPHATLTTGYEQAPDDPRDPMHTWFEDVVAFLKDRL